MSVPFLDLRGAHAALKDELTAAMERVLVSGRYVMGAELEAFESEFAAFCGVRHCIGVGNGMQAIELTLRALGVGGGDEVITVAHTAFPTVAAVTVTGATPVLVDVDPETCCMRPDSLPDALSSRTRAILPVHLYGRCADMDAIMEVADEAGVPVIEDAAQAHGAAHRGRRAGTIGRAAAFSFYPTKNLGAVGDAGAVVTDDDGIAAAIRRLRNYGEESKNVNATPGFNSRLDELQAAILRVKLPHLESWNDERRGIAAVYDRLLQGSAVVPPPPEDGHVYHLYVVRCRYRDALQQHLREAGVDTQVHYPTAVHEQPAYRGGAVCRAGSLETTERLSGQVLSLPAYPGLGEQAIHDVVDAVRSFAAP